MEPVKLVTATLVTFFICNAKSLQVSFETPSTPLAPSTPLMGWVGPYHPSNGIISDGSNRSVENIFRFGQSAVENSISDGKWLLKDDLQYHCYTMDVNQIMGIVLPPSEKGVINNPNDTLLYQPATPPGLIQGAARFSKLASVCPQLSGIVIDDFLQNYAGNQSQPCSKCPPSLPYPYGNPHSGEFCCPWPIDSTGHCSEPKSNMLQTNILPIEKRVECCIKPGYALNCQGYPRCGVNPMNRSACGLNKNKLITLHDLIQIKGALLGKDIDPVTGHVNMSSPSKTPWLRLFIVWYTRFTENYIDDGLLSGIIHDSNGAMNGVMNGDGAATTNTAIPIVDGVSLWIEGNQQVADYKNWTSEYSLYRTVTDSIRPMNLPRLATYGGSYIENSCCGIYKPYSFWSMFQQSIELYDNSEIEGFFIFSGLSIPKLNTSMWKEWNLEKNINTLYQPYLARACGTVPLNVRILVTRVNGKYGQRVTSKFGKNGKYCFDGWVGKKSNSALFNVSYENDPSKFIEVKLIIGRMVSFVLE